MILLRKKGPHGVGVCGKQRSILSPKWVESRTLEDHVQFIYNSHITTICAHPISPGNMLGPSKTAKCNWQFMGTKSELQKALHAQGSAAVYW